MTAMAELTRIMGQSVVRREGTPPRLSPLLPCHTRDRERAQTAERFDAGPPSLPSKH
jgi:hypothetical protein